MSKKRTAERELNHDNWNEEETPDEAGQFKVASEESMRERKVIKARRRNPAGSNPSENLFTAFKGFSNAPAIQPTPGTFDFLKNMNQPKPNMGSSTTTESTPTFDFFKNMNQSKSTTELKTAESKPTNSLGSFQTKPTTMSTTTGSTPTFDFLKNMNQNTESKPTNSLGSSTTVTPPDLIPKKPENPTNSFFNNSSWQKPPVSTMTTKRTETEEPSMGKAKRIKCDESEEKKKEDSSSNKTDSDAATAEAQKIFEDKVENLNIRFLNFLHDKIKANPRIILLPPLEDYRTHIERYLKERLEYITSKQFEKDGFNFDYIPQGSAGKLTLKNSKTGEVKTLPVGESGTKDSTSKFTGFKAAPTSKENFFAGSAHSKPSDTNATKPAPQFSFGNKSDTPAVTPGFSFKRSDNSESPAKSLASEVKPNFFGNLSKSESKTEPTTRPAFSWGSSMSKTETKPENGKSEIKSNFFANLNKSESKSEDTKPTGTPGFSWGSKSETSDTDKPSFFAKPDGGATKPFSFGFASAPPPAPAPAEEDEDVLPKEEVKEVVEEDSIFNIKCKIFVMKADKTYGERGVGNLFVKSIEDKVKGQVIVRTSTDTGKIIFNVIVSKNVPIKREKNNLMLVTVPHPTTEKDPKPVTCLIRVKTQEDAEKLLDCLQQFKE